MYISKYFTGSYGLLYIVILGFLAMAVMSSLSFKEGYTHYVTVDLPKSSDAVQFGLIEAALSDITLGSDNKLQLNAKSESSLSKAEISIAHNTSEQAITRTQLLIIKSFIGERGIELSNLFIRYHRYKKAERSQNDGAKDDMTLIDEHALIEEREALQIKYLGEDISQKLYGQQNTFARLLLKIRIIENNRDLSDEEREEKMHLLQEKINQLMQESA